MIHTVGPHYGVKQDAELLALTYRNVLDLAIEHDVHSIAFSPPMYNLHKAFHNVSR